jgi:CheY-like chemotaxis protein
MNEKVTSEPIDILLVEDNPGDVRLAQEALKDAKVRNRLFVAEDGMAAMDFLYKRGKYSGAPRPDLILLDLNLPKKDGRSVLADIKGDPALKRIPVVVMTSSELDVDILNSYDNHANCYVTKPLDLDQFIKIIHSIEGFWLTIVKLPGQG